MAQFSVHKNKNTKSKSAYPFLVDVQSEGKYLLLIRNSPEYRLANWVSR